jgi:hypothetical protein
MGARGLLGGFASVRLDLEEHDEAMEDGSTQLHSHWMARARKRGSSE